MYIVTDLVLNYLSLRYMLICYILVITKFSVLLVKAENTKSSFFLPKWHRLRARRNIRVRKKRVTKVRRTPPPCRNHLLPIVRTSGGVGSNGIRGTLSGCYYLYTLCLRRRRRRSLFSFYITIKDLKITFFIFWI